MFFEDGIVEIVAGLGVVYLFLIREYWLLDRLQIRFKLGVEVLGADHDAVGIVDGGLGEVHVVGLLEILEVFGCHARQLHLLVEACPEVLGESIVINGIDDLRLVEERVVADIHGALDVDRHQGRNPAMAVDDVGRPIEFLHRLDDASGEEDATAVVVLAEGTVFVIHQVFLLGEEVVVVDEINLHPRLLDGGHLDD